MNDSRYKQYLKNTAPTEQELKEQRKTRFINPPLISIICPTELQLDGQTYLNFEQTDEGAAKGEYLLILAEGAKLRNDALFHFAAETAEGADLVYCDEDECGKNPLFKPDFSPETLKSYNYIGSGILVSRDVYNKAGKKPLPRHDFALRAAAAAGRVGHIKKVLLSVKKRDPVIPVPWRTRFFDGQTSIIILCDSGYEKLKSTLLSIEQISVSDNYECVIADAAPFESRLDKLYENLGRNRAATVVRGRQDGNTAALLNRAAEAARGRYLLFLRAGTRPKSGDFLERMAELAGDKGIGAVGGKILNEDGSLSSCGIIVGLYGGLFSLYEDLKIDPKDEDMLRWTLCARNVTALKETALMVTAAVFSAQSGFDTTLSRVGFSEEFTKRLTDKGHRVVYTPSAEFVAAKSTSKITPDSENEQRLMDVFRPLLAHGDPFFNPSLDYNCNVIEVAPEPQNGLILHQKNGWWS